MAGTQAGKGREEKNKERFWHLFTTTTTTTKKKNDVTSGEDRTPDLLRFTLVSCKADIITTRLRSPPEY